MANYVTTLKDDDKVNDLTPRTVVKAICDENLQYLDSGLTAPDINALKGGEIGKLESNFAQIEVSPSLHAYSVGSMLVYNGILYSVTSAISVGDLLVIGTNIEKKSVSDSLSDIIASGTGYIKYFDGTLICYGKNEMQGNITEGIGSMYRGTFYPNIQFPISFTENPTISLTPASTSDFSFFSTYAVIRDNKKIQNVHVIRPTSASNATISFSWIAIGRWK